MKRSKRIEELESKIEELDKDDFQYLLIGQHLDHLPGDSPYPEKKAKHLWQRHGHEVIEYWTQPPKNARIDTWFNELPPGPFHRPFGWWEFETPDDLEGNRHTKIREYLQENDLLTETEKEELNR